MDASSPVAELDKSAQEGFLLVIQKSEPTPSFRKMGAKIAFVKKLIAGKTTVLASKLRNSWSITTLVIWKSGTQRCPASSETQH